MISSWILINENKNDKTQNESESYFDVSKFIFENYDSNILLNIQEKLGAAIEMKEFEQKFINGIIRKIKPQKILEVGVSAGGSTSIILNAIKDIDGAKLYSIEVLDYWYRNKTKKSGFLVEEKFPELMDKWSFYHGKITSEVIENIGNEIDLVYLDTMHTVPGELLDFLMFLPYLKEEAIIIIHDVFIMFRGTEIMTNAYYSNNQLLSYIRGDLILPSYGNSTFLRNIGAIKLFKDQSKYFKQYFLALGQFWQYMPKKRHLESTTKFFLKYYGKELTEIFEDAKNKNKLRFSLIRQK